MATITRFHVNKKYPGFSPQKLFRHLCKTNKNNYMIKKPQTVRK